MSLMEITDAKFELVDKLTEAEQKIAEAIRDVIFKGCEIGRILNEIEDQQLYLLREGCKSFRSYLENYSPLSRATCYEYQIEARVFDLLKKHELRQPDSAVILLEMGKRLPSEKIVEFWGGVLQAAEEAGYDRIRLKNVQKAIEAIPPDAIVPAPAAELSAPAKRGVDVELNLGEPSGNGTPAPAAAPAPLRAPPKKAQVYSDKGEEALDKIGRLCGKSVMLDIQKGDLKIPERSLKKWADEDDDTVRALKYYVADQGWPVEKALRHEQQSVTEKLTLGNMVTWATAHGGHWVRRFQGYRITLERI